MHFAAPQGGQICLDGKSPLELGVTTWRSLVTYVPQTRVHPKGTPAEFFVTVQASTPAAHRLPNQILRNTPNDQCFPDPYFASQAYCYAAMY